jgi:hypothetical protein
MPDLSGVCPSVCPFIMLHAVGQDHPVAGYLDLCLTPFTL